MDAESDRALEAARASGLIATDAPIVVLLSGGVDSVCALDVAVRLRGPGAVHALHVDHGLRDTAAEAALCAALCERLGVALAVRRPAGAPVGNVQAWARAARYAAAEELAEPLGALVATGHTATDQAETVLYRLAASPGRRALLGMPARSGRVVRPLLGVTRPETVAHCRRHRLTWCEDPTNADGAYARNRVRHGLVPALRDVHPAAERNLLRTVELLREEGAALEELVDGVLAGSDRVELARLGSLGPALRRLVVRRLAERAAGRPCPAAARRADELLALAPRGGSAALDLGGGVRAVVEYGTLRMTVVPPPRSPAAVELPVPGRALFGDCELLAVPGRPEPGDGVLDAISVGTALVVRAWRPGDRMAPVGLGGSRTLQDLFTDRRIPRERRAVLPVVEARGEIAWVPGVATAERFRVRAGAHASVRLSARWTTPGP